MCSRYCEHCFGEITKDLGRSDFLTTHETKSARFGKGLQNGVSTKVVDIYFNSSC